jgi:3-deoxy-manno-octulosonate cytidylyltransferase (CMP-KDO synthetase)
MNTEFHVIIPIRYGSARLPGKFLKDIAGQSMIKRVYSQAQKANPKSIVIAVDHPELAEHCSSFGAEVVMTSVEHTSGTERIAETITKGSYNPKDIIVNIQGDEPFIAPEIIQQAATCLKNSKAPMATLCWPIESTEQLINPNVVKVVRNKQNQALYFSRSPIPNHRDHPGHTEFVFRHIGIYAYYANFLLEYVSWSVCPLERYEVLEQLRVLWEGHPIQVEIACSLPGQDVNTEADLVLARSTL